MYTNDRVPVRMRVCVYACVCMVHVIC